MYEAETSLTQPWDISSTSLSASYGPAAAVEGNLFAFSHVITPASPKHKGYIRILPHSYPGRKC